MINLDIYSYRDLSNAIALLTDAVKYNLSIDNLLDKIKKQTEDNMKVNLEYINNAGSNKKKHLCKVSSHGNMLFCSANKIWYCEKCGYSEMP